MAQRVRIRAADLAGGHGTEGKADGAARPVILTAADVEPMRRLNAVFGDAFDDRATYEGDPPDDAYLAGLLGSQTFVAIAATTDAGDVVGGLAAYLLPKFEQRRSECYLYDLAVAAAFRRQGVATALIRRLQQWAGERGARVVFVQADRDDAPAIALYTRLGTREDVFHFDLAPPADGAAADAPPSGGGDPPPR